MIRSLAAALFFALGATLPAAAHDAPRWDYYVDSELGFEIELPLGQFQPMGSSDRPGAMQLAEVGGDALLEIYGGENVENLSAADFADFLSEADRVAEVTYRTGGRTWFVLSGYYRRDGFEAQELIFYTKFMFSPDLSHFAAFEISYPRSDKERMAPIVERLEDSFRGPPS